MSDVTCAELDRRAHLPPEPLPADLDVYDALLIQARRAQIHIEMRMELLAEVVEQQQRRQEAVR